MPLLSLVQALDRVKKLIQIHERPGFFGVRQQCEVVLSIIPLPQAVQHLYVNYNTRTPGIRLHQRDVRRNCIAKCDLTQKGLTFVRGPCRRRAKQSRSRRMNSEGLFEWRNGLQREVRSHRCRAHKLRVDPKDDRRRRS